MAPVLVIDYQQMEKRTPIPSMRTEPPTRESLTTEGGFLEAWAQGYNVGSLIILILIVFCNYRSGILLHKLILLELVLALWHGTFIFVQDPVYGWYLSTTATLLFVSYQIHNIVSWLKIRPFLPLWGSRVFIFSLLAVQPFWIAEAWSNFEYFNALGSDVNVRMRPFEALLRDPWWIFTTWTLVSAIKKTYGFSIWALVRINTRFGIMLACMFISIAFLLTDVGVNAAHITTSSGINPYWRFALVFKCASDTIFLDDFKSVLDDIIAHKLSSAGGGTVHNGTCNGYDTRKRKRSRSYSGMRGDAALVDCAPLSRPMQTPTMETSYSGPEWLKSFSACESHDRKGSIPKIHVHKETTVTSEARKPSRASHDSWHSDQGLLRTPEAAVHGPIHGAPLTTSAVEVGSSGFTQGGYEVG